MKTSEFLGQLKTLSVRVWSEGGELRVSAPKGVLNAELKQELTARKAEILAVLEGAGAVAGAVDVDAPIVPTVLPPRERPLSFTQQRLWFLQRLDPELAAYNIPMSWTLRGPLDAAALERALAEVVRRHAVLRTHFPTEAGRPYPQESGPEEIALERVARPADAGRSWRDEVVALLQRRAAVPFDLGAPGLLRPTLVELGPDAAGVDEHVLFCLVHHAVFDGWSIGRFLEELKACYAAFEAGGPSPLGKLPIQYADYAAWQRAALSGAAYRRELDYWRGALAGELPVLELPADRPRPPVQTFAGAKASRPLSPELIARLGELAGRENASLFMVCLAAYKALLARLTGLDDVIVASPIAGRERPELAELIGFFANTLVLRTDLSGDPSFGTLLARVRKVCLEAFDHQSMPFERLVDELAPERNLAYTPLFQTLFLIEEGVGLEDRMGSLEVSPFELETSVARADLMLYLYREKGAGRDGQAGDERWSVWAEYNTDLFDADTMDALLGRYVRVLEAVADAPEAPLSSIELLDPAERTALLEQWNDTAAELPPEPVHAQFERRVDLDPGATALVWPGAGEGDEQRLDYAELDARANRLAHHLIEAGAAPQDLVGLCLDRSVDMVVAQLAILKTGAAYVPLDPAFPPERLTYMVADSGLRLVVTVGDLVELAGGAQPVCLDREAEAIAARPAMRPGVEVDGRDPIYVIYTSGSTGRPKGVVLEHRSVSNFLASMAREPGFGPGDSILAVTTLSFDIAVLELLLPLVSGGTTVVAPREATLSGPALAELIERLRPGAMQATPATWRMLLTTGWEGAPWMRALCGGEALPRDLADALLARCAELWNLYGPTETTVWSTVARLTAETEGVPIGRPLANTLVYVLDGEGRLLPPGARGELWIGGEGLARGYLGRDELTAERFLSDPFAAASQADARMYRTGDLARWRPDGTLECLGRVDAQVKLRGYRIELGEIEALLSEHPAVDACAAIVREDVPGDQRLVAYLVAGSAGEPDVADLRARARGFLPGYMVPQTFQRLEALPLTPNGKVDRRALAALPAPSEGVGSAAEGTQRDPSTELERSIAEIWRGALRVDRVATDTNFFDLGGHSLLLAEVQVRLGEALGEEVSIVELFQYPTVGGLARHLAARNGTGKSTQTTGAGRAPEPDTDRRRQRGRNLSSARRAMRQRRGTRE